MQLKGQNSPRPTTYLRGKVWDKERKDLSLLAPREWPNLTYLSEEDHQQLLDLHPSASLLKAFSNFDVKLAQLFLYYTHADLVVG